VAGLCEGIAGCFSHFAFLAWGGVLIECERDSRLQPKIVLWPVHHFRNVQISLCKSLSVELNCFAIICKHQINFKGITSVNANKTFTFE
jgi:hypothetical protein